MLTSLTAQELTWEVIETKALVAGGANAEQAKAAVRQAIRAIKDAEVTGPVRIP